MDVHLQENERIDDLERNGYRIIQNRQKFCFGMDAVLLSGFAAEGEAHTASGLLAADLGTGTGIIPLLLCGRLRKVPELRITGLEIQKEMCGMAFRSVQLNDLEHRIRIVEGDLREAVRILGASKFDFVTSNPPYMKRGSGLVNPDSSRAVSRHEVLCTFQDVAGQAAGLLKPGGRFYLVHRPQRLSELMETLQHAGLEPKRLRMVHSFSDSRASMVLMEAVKGGGAFLQVERPLILYREQGVYTEEIRKLYDD